MKNPSPFPVKTRLVLVFSLVLLGVVIYFGGIQNLTEEKLANEPSQSAVSLAQDTPVDFVSQVDESSTTSTDLVATYIKMYGKYQVKAYANSKFSMPSDQEIEALRLDFMALSELYYKIPLAESKKVKRVSFPYAQLEVDGKISYKKFEDLTPAERDSLRC